MGNGVAAERILNRATVIWRRAPESVHPQLASTMVELGRWLAEQQRCDEAAPLLRRVVQIHAARQGPPSAAAAEVERLFAGCGVEPPTPAVG